MNLKIALAALTLVTGSVYTTSYAQQTQATQTAKLSRKTFETTVTEYQKTSDKAAADASFSKLMNQMQGDLAATKVAMIGVGDVNDKRYIAYETKAKAIRGVTAAAQATPADKASVVTALKKYAETL